VKIREFSPVLAAGLFAGLSLAYGADAPVSELGQGITAYSARDFKGAIVHLRGRQFPGLSDYLTYYLASSEQQTGDYDSALAALAAYRANPVTSSPLAGKIALLYGRVLLDKHEPGASEKALKALEANYKLLPEPDGDFALGLAFEGLGEKLQSVAAYQRVYYGYPNTDLAAQSWNVLERLRESMGRDFPVASPRIKLDRCARWLEAKQYGKARGEYFALSGSLEGAEKDEARVGMAAADYLSGSYSTAFRDLKSLHLAHSEADAERLYYLTEAARKTNDDLVMMDAIRELEQRYGSSPWRLKALLAAGNRYLVVHDRTGYTPLYKAAAEAFPSDASAPYAHWKVAWDAYLDSKPNRIDLLREQVELYPRDTTASSALFFLGRIAELAQRAGEARAYYDRLCLQYPHYFYGVMARNRIKDAKLSATGADDAVKEWLDGLDWPAHRDLSATEPNAATRLRIERARLLVQAGLPDTAEAELRFGAKTANEQPQLLALELARAVPSPFKALRAMKSLSSDYLSVPTASASPEFWQTLFPLPYRDELFRSARERGLDPFDVAALIRQESEFNPEAKSPANAYGLMQLIPSTGRMLSRQEGINLLRPSMLFNPALNIQLGTKYLRGQLDSWSGDWFQTLAAYNAGPGRVHQWLAWSKFDEPIEFVESIPFNETREYVQAVMRNADVYRELYDGKPLAGKSEPPPVPVAPVKKKPVTVAKKARKLA